MLWLSLLLYPHTVTFHLKHTDFPIAHTHTHGAVSSHKLVRCALFDPIHPSSPPPLPSLTPLRMLFCSLPSIYAELFTVSDKSPRERLKTFPLFCSYSITIKVCSLSRKKGYCSFFLSEATCVIFAKKGLILQTATERERGKG